MSPSISSDSLLKNCLCPAALTSLSRGFRAACLGGICCAAAAATPGLICSSQKVPSFIWALSETIVRS